MGENTNKEVEWDDNEICPCGSGKTYKKCCKKKQIKYYKKNKKEYIKSIKMDKEIEEVLDNCEKRFKEIFGRNLSQEDYLIFDALDNDMEKFIRKLKYYSEVPNDYVYAYDRTGLMVSPFNKDKLPDIEIEEFERNMQEYHDLMEQPIKNNEANILQVAEATNSYLKNVWEESVEDIIYVLNRYIKEMEAEVGIKKGFTIKERKDFFVYCSYKTIQNLKTLKDLIEQGYIENSFAVVRFIYEILLNVIVFKNDEELFNNKILPLAGLDIGTFEKKDNYTLIEKATGKEYYCKIRVNKLAEQAGDNFETLYNTLYYDLSGFIHVDTLTAKKIFSEVDNFLDIDECYAAGVCALAFAVEIIGGLAKFDKVPKQLQEDLNYFINNKIKMLLEALDTILVLDSKEVYKTIKKTLEFYQKNSKI